MVINLPPTFGSDLCACMKSIVGLITSIFVNVKGKPQCTVTLHKCILNLFVAGSARNVHVNPAFVESVDDVPVMN